MFLKKYTVAAAILMSSASVLAAETVQFNVEASIPTANFYVVPEGDWNVRPVRLNYNPVSSSLSPAAPVFLRAKNTSGSITAYLDMQPQLTNITNGHNIPLTIKIADKELPVGSTSAVEVVSETQATNESRLPVLIAPSDTATYQPGDYLGTVTMMFDAVAES